LAEISALRFLYYPVWPLFWLSVLCSVPT